MDHHHSPNTFILLFSLPPKIMFYKFLLRAHGRSRHQGTAYMAQKLGFTAFRTFCMRFLYLAFFIIRLKFPALDTYTLSYKFTHERTHSRIRLENNGSFSLVLYTCVLAHRYPRRCCDSSICPLKLDLYYRCLHCSVSFCFLLSLTSFVSCVKIPDTPDK